LFVKWQERGKVDAGATPDAPKVSRFGRPLRRMRRTPAPVTVGGADVLEAEPAGST
jgi:hypothetical protein